MKFAELVEELKNINEFKIVLINAGAFYIAIEDDAVLLHRELGLKCTCFQKGTCKVGIPINSLDKYLAKIENLGYSYMVFWLDREKQELKIIREFEGEDNEIDDENINCQICKGIDIETGTDYSKVFLNYCKNKNKQREKQDESK